MFGFRNTKPQVCNPQHAIDACARMAAKKSECFEPSPWLLAASEWGSSGRHQSTISHRHISRVGLMLVPERVPSKRDATGARRLSGYCAYGAIFSRFCQKFPVCVSYGNLGAGI